MPFSLMLIFFWNKALLLQAQTLQTNHIDNTNKQQTHQTLWTNLTHVVHFQDIHIQPWIICIPRRNSCIYFISSIHFDLLGCENPLVVNSHEIVSATTHLIILFLDLLPMATFRIHFSSFVHFPRRCLICNQLRTPFQTSFDTTHLKE